MTSWPAVLTSMVRRARSSSSWWRAAEATDAGVIVIVLPWMRTISDGTAATTTTVVTKTATIRVVMKVTIAVIIPESPRWLKRLALAKLAEACKNKRHHYRD